MRRRLLCVAILLTMTAVACSVVDDGKVERIQPQFGLDDTLPSSTSIATSISLFETTTTGLETTTTAPQPQTEAVRLYYVASGQLTYVSQPLASPVTLGQVIAALQTPPAGDLGAGLRTVLPSFAEMRATTDGSGIATVTLPEDFFDLVPGLNDQRLVIAQLVLTLTSFRGIGQVTFNLPVPLPTGQERPAGLELTFSDYKSMTDSNLDVPDPTFPLASTTTTGG